VFHLFRIGPLKDS